MRFLALNLAAMAAITHANTQFAGVNIAGFSFGCNTTGFCDLSEIIPPVAALGGPDGMGQMQHFVKDDLLNAFRLPVGWGYLMESPGSKLNSQKFSNYDLLVQGCLSTGSLCIIDIHNYARWNGGIIGQGGPSNAQFVNLWTQLAQKYADQCGVAFGIMNEPHNIPNINAWANTVQLAVTAIRNAGARSQLILLPGNNWASADSFVSSGSAAALSHITNPDGSNTNLIFDIHKYLDVDNTGTHTECVANNINSFSPLATWLRSNGRKAFITETGGGNTASCATYLCQELQYINSNSDVYLGYTTWAAGAFPASWNYALTEVPTVKNGIWTDTSLVQACIAR